MQPQDKVAQVKPADHSTANKFLQPKLLEALKPDR